MELHERIKELRKNHLHLSQTEFGEMVGVSRSVINNIERNVLARPDQKLSLMKLICSKFNVNEEWLLNGTEPMFVEPDKFSLDKLEIRKKAINYFKKKISNTSNATPTQNIEEEIVSEPVMEAEASYIKRRSASAQKMTSSALNTIGEESKVSSQ